MAASRDVVLVRIDRDLARACHIRRVAEAELVRIVDDDDQRAAGLAEDVFQLDEAVEDLFTLRAAATTAPEITPFSP